MKTILSYRRLIIWFCHIGMIAAALVLAFLLRLDLRLPPAELPVLLSALAIAVPVKALVFHLLGMDRGWWRFAGIADLSRVFYGNVLASAASAAPIAITAPPSYPRSVYLIDFLVCFLLTAGCRFAVRLYNEASLGDLRLRQQGKGVLIYGAGVAGMTLVREIRGNPSVGYHILGFLDDDPSKCNALIGGVSVLGRGRDAPHVVERYRHTRHPVEEIIIAMPSAAGLSMREALANARAAGVACKTVPGLSEMLRGRVLSDQIRNISVTDLLGRRPVRLDENRIRDAVAGKSLLVTGAAGSIGSELCRQLAAFLPARLVLFDQAESELFKIDIQLREQQPSVNIVPELGDVRDGQRVDEVIRRHRIQSIFHAAAYKHVPMMEAHVLEAARNNVMGTWNVVQAAHRNRVANFLMISSDKAVNPSSIMGVTKRVAELIVSGMPFFPTRFVSVRFGNVLGSNGSVVPLFQTQIAAGGPVTVTHPEAKRYFMTIREAVQLVLQASTMGKGAEIFVLDMGEPIRILDLAKTLIRLSGLEEDRDIEIRIVGLRPGEKLFEELALQGEGMMPTYHEKIKIFQGPRVDYEVVELWIGELRGMLERRDADAVVAHLRNFIPEYHPSLATAAGRG